MYPAKEQQIKVACVRAWEVRSLAVRQWQLHSTHH
jgi:hypothetical protein